MLSISIPHGAAEHQSGDQSSFFAAALWPNNNGKSLISR